MADNVEKGVADVIAESDNETAGQLITRLREAHVHGQDNAELQTANPTQLISKVDVFSSGDVGKELDLINPAVGALTGFEGTYLVGTFVSAKIVTLTKIDGSAPSFTDTDPVRWRFSTLRVETTLSFQTRDRLLRLWVGEEPDAIRYAQVVQTPGAQEFRGLGTHQLSVWGSIRAAAPTTVSNEGAFFTSDHIGRALYVLPTDPANGNEGPQLITAVAADGKSCTVSPGGLTTDEDLVWFVVKEYGESGRLTGLRPPLLERRALTTQSPVIDGSRAFSSLDRLRRSFLVDYATEEELDRIGRNLAVFRPFGTADEIMRCLLKTLAYLPRATVYGIELVLECLFPGGGYSVYEDLINFPNKVFILLEALAGTSEDFEGKTFLSPAGKDVTPPIDPSKAGGSAIGRGGRELQTSSSATSVTVAHTPTTVVDVLLEDFGDLTDMDVLPSADTPAWTYQAQNSAAEGTVFSVVSVDGVNVLQQVFPGASDEGGRYTIATPTQDHTPGSFFEVEVWFRVTSFTSASAKPWALFLADDVADVQVGLFWDTTTIQLDYAPDTGTLPEQDLPRDLSDGEWVLIKLRRDTIEDQHYITGSVSGKVLFDQIPVSTFIASAADSLFFGYFYQSSETFNATAQWKNLKTRSRSTRNYFNINALTGFFSGTNENVLVTGSPFVAGDVNKRFRVHGVGTASDARMNLGEWNVKAFVSANELTLEGILSEEIISVSTVGGEHFITSMDPVFTRDDVRKQIEVVGSALGNDGPRKVLEVISAKILRVDGTDFSAEQGLQYQFNPFDGTTAGQFASASSFGWELVDASSVAGSVLTLRDSLPAANTDVAVNYTAVLSAQIVRNEFVRNDGSLGSAPNVFYPFYLFDVDRATRQLLDEVTAAGVIPAFEREF